MDKGQFTYITMEEGRDKVLAAVVHPDGVGAAVRLCADAELNHILAAHRLVCVLSALHLQRSQKGLVAKLEADLETSLNDYMENESESSELPF